MDLSVKLVLRAQAEGTSAIKAMREETSELAAAMKEVRAAARSGGSVSGASIKALGGFDEFQKRFTAAQKELAEAAKPVAALDEEKAFRARVRMTNAQAKVRLAESARVVKEEAATAAKGEADQRREAEETLNFRMRMWAQQRRAAEAEAAAEARAVEESEAAQRRAAQETLSYNMRMWAQRGRAAQAEEVREARQRREMLHSMGLGMFAGPLAHGEKGDGGHGHGRSLMSEFKTAAGYTLTYGAINKALEGVGAVLHSPISIGQMTLGVAQRSREVKELGQATRLTTNQVQELQYAFAAKGLDADKLPQTLLWLARSEVGAARGIKNNATAFKALGVNVFDSSHHLRGLQALLYATTDALHRQTSAAKADAISQMIFGRGVKDILPIIQGGSQALRSMASEADKSGFVITPEDLDRGEQLAAQWSRLKLQLAGVRNATAVAAMPIVSDLLGEASGYLTSHRAEVVRDIKQNFAELKTDLPVIVAGLKSMADSTLAMSRGIGPFVADLVRLGQSPIGRYLFSGQVVPGIDLGRQSAGVQKRQDDYLNAYDPLSWLPHGKASAPAEVHVHVHAAPGVAVGASTSRGATLIVHRGQVQTGG